MTKSLCNKSNLRSFIFIYLKYFSNEAVNEFKQKEPGGIFRKHTIKITRKNAKMSHAVVFGVKEGK